MNIIEMMIAKPKFKSPNSDNCVTEDEAVEEAISVVVAVTVQVFEVTVPIIVPVHCHAVA